MTKENQLVLAELTFVTIEGSIYLKWRDIVILNQVWIVLFLALSENKNNIHDTQHPL